jgi:hypothetical protein
MPIQSATHKQSPSTEEQVKISCLKSAVTIAIPLSGLAQKKEKGRQEPRENHGI